MVQRAILILFLTSLIAACGASRPDSGLRSAEGISIAERFEFFGSLLLGKPYDFSGPLGEGRSGILDKDPLFRFDRCDCTTLVETVLAQTAADGFRDFKDHINQIRYLGGEVKFIRRNHFPSTDWIPNNIAAGYLADVTQVIADRVGAEARVADEVAIDKKNWFKTLFEGKIDYSKIDYETRVSSMPYIHFDQIFDLEKVKPVVERYKAKTQKFRAQIKIISDRISALPEASPKLLELQGELDFVRQRWFQLSQEFHVPTDLINTELLAEIPDAAVINVAAPAWDLRKYIGTPMNVSHQGMAVRKHGKLYFRHASSDFGQVVDSSFAEYFAYYVDLDGEQPRKGINVLEVLVKQ